MESGEFTLEEKLSGDMPVEYEDAEGNRCINIPALLKEWGEEITLENILRARWALAQAQMEDERHG